MRNGVATTAETMFYNEVSHMMGMRPYDDDSRLITYGDVWASMPCNVGGETLGGSAFFLPLDGNIIAT